VHGGCGLGGVGKRERVGVVVKVRAHNRGVSFAAERQRCWLIRQIRLVGMWGRIYMGLDERD
jgi:hypothetical protein